MKIERTEFQDLQTTVTMTVEPADYQDEVQKELKTIRQKANIPGFRPGMVPMGMVKKMYGKGVMAEVINKTIGTKLSEYIETEKLQVLGEPLPNEEKTPAVDFDNQDTFTFAFDIAVAPEFQADLTAKDKVTEYQITVTDEMVSKQIEAYTQRFGEYVDDEEAEEKDGVKPKKIIPAKVDGELFAKVYGENTIKDEADFRAHVRAEIEQNMAEDSKYKLGLDLKAAILNKMEKVAFPDAFLKRWVLATNDKMTAETLDKEYPSMLTELKWQLAKDQLVKKYEIKVEKEDVEAYAKEVARLQFIQYGLMHVDDSFLASYAQEMLKKEDQLRGLVERVAENKIYAALKGVAKVEEKKISHEDFGKLFQ